jgi:hypothetical protein
LLLVSPDSAVIGGPRSDQGKHHRGWPKERIPRLVVLIRRYRRCDRVALFAADASWRLSFATDETIAYRPDRNLSMIESTSPLAAGVLESLAGSAGILADLLPNAEQVA